MANSIVINAQDIGTSKKMQSMRVKCVCGEEKPHGQIVWLRVEIEIPEDNNDEQYIEFNAFQRQIPICRSCLKKILNARVKDKGKANSARERALLDILRKKKDFTLHDDDAEPDVLDCVIDLLFDLHNGRSEFDS